MTATFIKESGWLTDANGNRASVEWFGTREAAEAALASLKDCRDCVNCSDCSGCSGCSRCSDCSGCSGCLRCSDCSDCLRCSDCSDCSGCSDCSDCSDCSGCLRCSDCSDCSGCSDCSDCEHIAHLLGRNGLRGDPEQTGPLGPPAIPVIENIHKAVFAAASAPKALNMGNWHSCNTTHCRAGWVVHLAGDAGYTLERFHNTPLAAQLIYQASGYDINPCRFYDGDAAALEDMKALAEGEPESATT